MKKIYSDRDKENKKALDRLLESAITTVKTMSTRREFAGVYILRRPDDINKVVWVGEPENIAGSRMNNHMQGSGKSNLNQILPRYPQNPVMYKIQYRQMGDESNRKNFEKYVTSILEPTFNK